MDKEYYPFKGIRVLEFTHVAAGPFTGKVLADFGAEVIVIESRTHVISTDSGRRPPAGAKNPSSLNAGLFYNKFNTNKLSLTMNMRYPKGIEIAKKLIAQSDVIIDNYSPYVLEKWGIDYAEAVKIKPDIIMLRMPTMGKGPYRNYRSSSWILLGLAGMNYISQAPGRPPICPCSLSLPDVSCNPFHASTALIAALYYRAATGKGQFIELSQYESTLCITGTSIFNYLVNGEFPPSSHHPDQAAPQGMYPCLGEDRWCAISVFTDEQWEAFCDVLGKKELAGDGRYNSPAKRRKHAEELYRLISEWTSHKTAEEVMELMQSAGIAAGVVQNVEDLVKKDPQLKANGYWKIINHPEEGELLCEDWGFRLSGLPEPLASRPPLLGEHNDYILGHILGMKEEEINQLVVDGVLH